MASMIFLWIVTAVSLIAALVSWSRARRIARTLEQLSQLYWELKYQHGELRVQMQRSWTDARACADGAPPPGPPTCSSPGVSEALTMTILRKCGFPENGLNREATASPGGPCSGTSVGGALRPGAPQAWRPGRHVLTPWLISARPCVRYLLKHEGALVVPNRIRCRGDWRRYGRLCGRHPRGAAREKGCRRREAEGARRHVPDLGLHPDQGAARARPRAEDHPEREGVGRHAPSRHAGIDMGQVQARKDKIVSGLTKGIEFLFKKNKIDWIKGTARLAGNGKHRGVRRRQADARREGDHRRHRLGAAQRSGHRDRPHTNHHQRRSDPPEERAQVARHHGQRRRRRGVRVDLPAVRQRGHDHRAAAAARAGRRRSGVGRAREVVQEAGHQVADRHEGDEGGGDGERRRHRGAGRRTARRRSCRPSSCSSPRVAAR